MHSVKFDMLHVKQFELVLQVSQRFLFKKALLKQERHLVESPASQVLQGEVHGIQFPLCKEYPERQVMQLLGFVEEHSEHPGLHTAGRTSP